MQLIQGLLSFVLLFSAVGAQADWTDQFIGTINFRLSDDPDYSRSYSEVQSVGSTLTQARAEADKRKRHLDEASRNYHNKGAELQKAKTSLENKQRLLQTNQSSISTLEAQKPNLQREISALTIKIEDLRRKVNSLGKEKAELESQLSTTTDPATQDSLKRRISDLNREISSVQAEIKTASNGLREAEAQLTANTNKVAELRAQNTTITNEIPGIQNSISRLNTEVAQAKQQVDNLATALQQQMSHVAGLENRYQRELNEFERIKNQLISEIISFNRQGYDRASNDGAREGLEIAQRVGNSAGQYDGNRNGLARGEADGRARDYDIGVRQGDQKGSADGSRDGANVGHADGIVAGNREAGRRAGAANGVRRAEASDARRVGEMQGTQAGFDEAVVDGKIEGYKQGEAEAINSNESAPLSDKMINGQFAGTFQGSVPGYPGAQGTYFNNNVNIYRYVVKQAYVAGYNYGYNPASERTFYNNIRGIYDGAYNSAYSYAYNQAYSVQYEDSRRLGEERQYKVAYAREYERYYDDAYDRSFEQTVNSPNSAGADYQNSYKRADAEHYAAHYEKLRKESFDLAFDASYQKHIGEQTQKYRLERIAQVDSLYANFPVLKFVSESIWDAGTKKVGVKDEIYMPGEDIAHDVVIINYGAKAADGVEVKIDEVNAVVLPQISGKSKVTIAGAALHRLNASLAVGATSASKLSARFALASGDQRVQGHHFLSASEGVLARPAAKTVTAKYPVIAANPQAKTAVFIRQPVKLKLALNNISKKAISNLTVKLETSLGDSVISNEFAPIAVLESALSAEDAEIHIREEADLFSTISFKASVYSNGVFLGASVMGGEEIVRAGYEEKPGKPVVVFSSISKDGRDAFKDLMNESGGMSNISIIDLNGPSQNIQTLGTKMAGKTLLVALDKEGKVLQSLAPVFKNEKTLVAILNGNDSVLNQVRNSLSTAKDATILPLEYKGHKLSVLSTAPIFNQEVKTKNSMISFELRDLEFVHTMAKVLKLSDDELLATLGKTFTMEAFLSVTDEMLLLNKIIGLRAIEDVMGVSSAYEISEDKHVKKVLRKMFKNEDDLILRKFRNMFEKGEKETRLAASAVAYPLQHGINFLVDERDPFQGLIPRIKRNVKWSIRDFDNDAKRFIKKNLSKAMVKQIEAVESSYYVIQ